MNDTTFTPSTGTPAYSRTFNVLSVARECGVVVDVSTSTVQLTRSAAGLIAEIDGVSADLTRAVALLRTAERVWLLEEVLMPEVVAAPIGKPAAHQLHIELGRLGYKSHYALASEVLGVEVTSLAALNAEDAATVRSYAYGQLGLTTGSVAA